MNGKLQSLLPKPKLGQDWHHIAPFLVFLIVIIAAVIGWDYYRQWKKRKHFERYWKRTSQTVKTSKK